MRMPRHRRPRYLPGQAVALKPGGYHLMFMEIKQPLKARRHRTSDADLENAAKQRETLELKVPVRQNANTRCSADFQPSKLLRSAAFIAPLPGRASAATSVPLPTSPRHTLRFITSATVSGGWRQAQAATAVPGLNFWGELFVGIIGRVTPHAP